MGGFHNPKPNLKIAEECCGDYSEMSYPTEAPLHIWNDGIMGSGLRLGEDIGMVGLENQNEYKCIDFLVIVACFMGRKQKMDV
jgi:hypothetical protein